MVVKGLPTLSSLQLIRAKLRAFSKRDGFWDGQDILFLLGHRMVQYTIDRDQISEGEAQYFMDNFEWDGLEEQKAKVGVALLGDDFAPNTGKE